MFAAKLVIFDLDGTLFRGSEVIPGGPEAVTRLRDRGAMIRYLTNNSGATPTSLVGKLSSMGYPVKLDEVLTSGMGAVRYARESGFKRVFLVSEPGLREVAVSDGLEVASEGNADAVIVGICRSFTYALLDQALQHVLQGAEFIATNTDSTYPLEGGRVSPGAGSIVASLATASGVTPRVIGKPEPTLVKQLINQAGVLPEETLVVGDRYETDIVAGERAGCQVLMVLSGVASEPVPGVQAIASIADMI